MRKGRENEASRGRVAECRSVGAFSCTERGDRTGASRRVGRWTLASTEKGCIASLSTPPTRCPLPGFAGLSACRRADAPLQVVPTRTRARRSRRRRCLHAACDEWPGGASAGVSMKAPEFCHGQQQHNAVVCRHADNNTGMRAHVRVCALRTRKHTTVPWPPLTKQTNSESKPGATIRLTNDVAGTLTFARGLDDVVGGHGSGSLDVVVNVRLHVDRGCHVPCNLRSNTPNMLVAGQIVLSRVESWHCELDQLPHVAIAQHRTPIASARQRHKMPHVHLLLLCVRCCEFVRPAVKVICLGGRAPAGFGAKVQIVAP